LTEFMHLDMKYNTLLTFSQIGVVPIDAAKIILQAVLSFWIFLGIFLGMALISSIFKPISNTQK